MTELELDYLEEIVTTSSTPETNEKIAPRRTVVYKTLIDPALIRVAAEKNKHKLFNKFLFKLNKPEEIEFISTEKYYEPYTTVSGKYFIDYYRKSTYTIRVDKQVKEILLLNKSFTPKSDYNLLTSEHNIKLEGEERIVRNLNAFLFLDRNGKELRINDFPPAPSEEKSEELVKTLKMQVLDPNTEVEAIRKRIAQRPYDANRIVKEHFEIDERSIIYRPVFKVNYKCSKIGKEAYFEFDGVTSKIINQKENVISATAKSIVTKLKRIF